MIKIVSFDLWFTLIWEDDKASYEYREKRINAIYNVFREYNPRLKLEDIHALYDLTSHIRMIISNEELIRLIGHMAGIEVDNELVERAVNKYIEATCSWNPYVNKEALTILPRLKKETGLKVVILSNTSFAGKAIETILKNIGIGNYIDHVFSSADIGCVKPMPKAFQAIFTKYGVEPHEVMHVGDTYLDDVIGAINAGSWGVLYKGLWRKYDNYREYKTRVAPRIHGTISVIEDLNEVHGLIKSLACS